MKNKRLAIILIILTFFAVVVVLSSTVFSLSKVDVNFLTTTDHLTGQAEDIVESANFNLGENVLFVNKNLHTTLLEKQNPYLKVVNIETIFPNKIVLNVAERNEVFSIKLPDNSYAICDEELKVLKTSLTYYNSAQNAIELKNVTVLNSTVSAGDFLTVEESGLIKSTFNCLREWDLSYVNLKAKITSITINYDRLNQILINMRSGVQIKIKDAEMFLSDKLNLAFSFYSNTQADYTSEGVIEIRQLTDGSIRGFYYVETND